MSDKKITKQEPKALSLEVFEKVSDVKINRIMLYGREGEVMIQLRSKSKECLEAIAVKLNTFGYNSDDYIITYTSKDSSDISPILPGQVIRLMQFTMLIDSETTIAKLKELSEPRLFIDSWIEFNKQYADVLTSRQLRIMGLSCFKKLGYVAVDVYNSPSHGRYKSTFVFVNGTVPNQHQKVLITHDGESHFGSFIGSFLDEEKIKTFFDNLNGDFKYLEYTLPRPKGIQYFRIYYEYKGKRKAIVTTSLHGVFAELYRLSLKYPKP